MRLIDVKCLSEKVLKGFSAYKHNPTDTSYISYRITCPLREWFLKTCFLINQFLRKSVRLVTLVVAIFGVILPLNTFLNLNNQCISRDITKTQLNASQDVVHIKDHNFEWNIIEQDFCSVRYPNVKMLIVVHTAIPHFATRQTYREMYGDRFYEQLGVVTLFFVGMPSDDEEQLQILNESQTHHDIIQQDFLDTYRNLTWKAISWLQYVKEFCEKVEFIIKIDDDMKFDLTAIEKYLRRKSLLSNDANANANMILCNVFSGYHLYPIRDKCSKWYVTTEEYEPDFYYPFCRGQLYVMSRRTAVNLLKASVGEKYFWLDDYFITGHLGRKIGVTFDNVITGHLSYVTGVTFENIVGSILAMIQWWKEGISAGVENPRI